MRVDCRFCLIELFVEFTLKEKGMSLASFSLEGKKALVVGGRRNMGKGFALGLAEAGADVAVTDINLKEGRLQSVADEIEAMGRRSLAIQTDISKKSEVDSLVAEVVENLGGIDILMNVAVMYHRKSLTEFEEADCEELTNVNLKGYEDYFKFFKSET